MSYYLIYYDEENASINLGLAFQGNVNWSQIFETAEKYPDQSSSNNTIGIGTSGNPVNMDDWNSVKTTDGNYRLNGIEGYTYKGAYSGGYTENGEIIGEIPQYIKKDEDDRFYPVTELRGTFINNTTLKIAPKIPETVTSMFRTLEGCTNLAQAPEIPSNVTDMGSTFRECTNLTGIVEINANPRAYIDCFNMAATAENANLVLAGSSTMLQKLLETAGSDSHISIPK